MDRTGRPMGIVFLKGSPRVFKVFQQAAQSSAVNA